MVKETEFRGCLYYNNKYAKGDDNGKITDIIIILIISDLYSDNNYRGIVIDDHNLKMYRICHLTAREVWVAILDESHQEFLNSTKYLH